MIVSCSTCGTKYRIDPSNIKGNEARFRCKSCFHMISITKDDQQTEALPSGADDPMLDPGEGAAGKVNSELKALSPQPASTQPDVPASPTTPKSSRFTTPKKYRFGLTGKVISLMLLVSLLPLLILWGFTFRETTNRVRKDTEIVMEEIAAGLTNHVNEWIDKNVRVMNALAHMPDIVSMERERQEPLLRSVSEAYPWMYLVFTVGKDGMNVARNDNQALKDYSDRHYYKGAMQGNDVTWQTLISRTVHKPAIVMSVPIRENDEIVGVMAIGMTIDEMSKRIANWKRGETGYAFLIDDLDKVVAHQKNEFVMEQQKLTWHPLITAYKQGQRGPTLFKDANGNSSLGFVKATNYGWLLALQQEEKEVFQVVEWEKRFAYSLLAITVLAVLIIALVGARAITTPIKKLTMAADSISVGELDVPIEARSGDEIGDLSHALIRMQESIRLSIERLRKRR